VKPYAEGIAQIGLFFEELEREGVASFILDAAAEWLQEKALPVYIVKKWKRRKGRELAYLDMDRLMPALARRVKQLGGDFKPESVRRAS